MRGVFTAILACVWFGAMASPAVPGAPVESTGLRSIAGWLKTHGASGFVATDLADAMGIPHEVDAELIAVRQRGYRNAEGLRVAQMIDGQYLLFMVQGPAEVYFYLSTVKGGLRKALVSIPDREAVAPLEAAEAETNFRREVLYWEGKVAQ